MKRKILIIATLSAMVVAPVVGVKYENNLHSDFVATQNIKSDLARANKGKETLNALSVGSIVSSSSSINTIQDLSRTFSSLSKNINKIKNLSKNSETNGSKIITPQLANDIRIVNTFVTKAAQIISGGGSMVQTLVKILAGEQPYQGALARFGKESYQQLAHNIQISATGPGTSWGIDKYKMHIYFYFLDGTKNTDGTAHISHGEKIIGGSSKNDAFGSTSSSNPYGQGIFIDATHALKVKIEAAKQKTVGYNLSESGYAHLASIEANSLNSNGENGITNSLYVHATGKIGDPNVYLGSKTYNLKTKTANYQIIGNFGVYNIPKNTFKTIEEVLGAVLAFNLTAALFAAVMLAAAGGL